MQKAAAACGAAEAAEDKLQAAIDRQAGTISSGVILLTERTRAFDRLRAAADPVVKAQQAVERAATAADAAIRQGSTTADEAARVVGIYQQRLESAKAAADRHAVANDNPAKSSGIASHQLQNLGYQINDVVTSFASGAPAVQVLAQQGGQVVQILGETGVSGALRGIGGAIARFLTPVTVTVGALAGAVVLGYGAGSRYDDETRKVGVTLQGLARETGLTREAFEKLATSAAAGANGPHGRVKPPAVAPLHGRQPDRH